MAMFTTVQPVSKPETTTKPSANYDAMASLLAAVMLTMYAGAKSKKQLRKIKRKATFLLMKEKLKSLFKRPKGESLSRTTLMYILLGVLVLALLFIEPIAALVLAILGLILILAGVV